MKRYTAVLVLCMLLFTPVAKAQSAELAILKESLAAEKSGNREEALALVVKALRENASSYIGNLRAGYLCAALERYDDAIKYYKKAYRVEKKALDPLLGLSASYAAQGDWNKTVYYCQRAIRLDKENYTATIRIAYAYFMMNNYGKAYHYYESLHELYPSDTTVLMGLVWTMIKAGKEDVALRYLQKLEAVDLGGEKQGDIQTARQVLAEMEAASSARRRSVGRHGRR